MRARDRRPPAANHPSLGGGVLPELHSREAVIELIRSAIAPIIGETMASASPQALASKLGLEGPHLTPAQAVTLIERVCQGLVVFVGRQRATTAQQDIEKALTNGKAHP